MVRRLFQLYAGLVLYGFSMALLVEAGLGLDPWDVLHQGVAERTSLTIGMVTIAVGALVLLAWIPLRQRPGLGTISNVIVIGLAVDAAIWALPSPDVLAVRIAFLAGGVTLNAVATAAYIGARLGPGPRDGLMTGLVARTGRSVRVVRTSIEVTVLATGWLLGGTVGVGTVVYALAIGPLVHILLPRFEVRAPVPVAPVPPAT
ncbi:YczE/YyaS/YitT family protein [Jiangella gansuensis]|uniref:membrane protein YczE n=1 Tax=Jiangella gansuensis TaxID=281473 RepID=UPI00047D5A1C|nr:membrane protein [Jiangella gansuensis]